MKRPFVTGANPYQYPKMNQIDTLTTKAFVLNTWIEDVKNWVIHLENQDYTLYDPKEVARLQLDRFMHENLVAIGRVMFRGFGKIYKELMMTSDKYQLRELPREHFAEIMTAFFSPPGQDGMNPMLVTTIHNCIIYEAKWWPPDDYVKQLVEKRNFMTLPEFQLWSILIDNKFKEVGGGRNVPNYIKHKPFSQFPGGN